jgi:hypothetical protein
MSVIRTVALPIGLGLGFGLTLEYGFNVPFYIALPAGGALTYFLARMARRGDPF